MKLHPNLAALMISVTFIAGAAGSAAAAPDNRDVVHTRQGVIVVNSWGNCVRTKWMGASDECAPEKVTKVERTERRVLAQEERTVYFPFNQSTLVADQRQKLDSLANVLKSDKGVTGARIVGYADRIGTASYNEKLSKKRAEVVKNYIVSHGFAKTSVAETRWFGESVPSTNCPDTLPRPELIACLQKDRRVEVEIDYLPEGTAPVQR